MALQEMLLSFGDNIRLFALAFAIAFPQLAVSQHERKIADTTWYDDTQMLNSRQHATGYRLAAVKTDSGYRSVDYDLTGRLKAISYASRPNHIGDSDYYIYYDSLGRKTSEGGYDFGKPTGRWRFFYRGSLSVEGTYKYGDRSGLWRQYYAGTDKLYRKGSYFLGGREGAFRTYHRNGQLKRLEYYDGGRLLKGGTCYDSAGHVVAYTPFIIEPTYKGHINKLVDRVCDKPRKHGKLWFVYTDFQFTIGRDGSVGELKLTLNETNNCTYIKKIVSGMAAWKPMVLDGHAIKSRANGRLCVWREGARIEIKFSPLEEITLLL